MLYIEKDFNATLDNQTIYFIYRLNKTHIVTKHFIESNNKNVNISVV